MGVFRVGIQEAAATVLLTAQSHSCLSVLVNPTCLAAFQNKHLAFGAGRLVFAGPTLCKIRARIYGAWLNPTWNTTKRYCQCCETFPNEGSSSGSWLILLEMSAVLALKVQPWSVCLNAAVAPGFHCCRRAVHGGRSKLQAVLLVRYSCQQRVFGLWMTWSSSSYSNGCFRLNYLVTHKTSFQYVLSVHPVCGFLSCTALKLFPFSI